MIRLGTGAESKKRKSMATETKVMNLKLLVDGGSKKVLYAEAKKDFIDFLFGLLQIPLGSIMTLLGENGFRVPGSLGRVLESVTNLGTSHFHSSQLKDTLLNPKVASQQAQSSYRPPLLLQEFASWEFNDQTQRADKVEGYLKEDNCGYMVMDDLVVSPMSTISVFALLKRFNIKDLGLLEEKTVEIDLKQGLALVKAAMESETALTDVFMCK